MTRAPQGRSPSTPSYDFDTMLIGLSIFELHLPHSTSLKEKRKVVKGLVDSLYHRYRVSVLESGFHDLHQRAEVSVAYLARSEGEIVKMADEIRRIADEIGEAVVSKWDDRTLESID